MRRPRHLMVGMTVFVDGDPQPWEFRGRFHDEYYGTVRFLGNGRVRSTRDRIKPWDQRIANLRRGGPGLGEFEFASVPYPRLWIR